MAPLSEERRFTVRHFCHSYFPSSIQESTAVLHAIKALYDFLLTLGHAYIVKPLTVVREYRVELGAIKETISFRLALDTTKEAGSSMVEYDHNHIGENNVGRNTAG